MVGGVKRMEKLLQQLNKFGVHYVISDSLIILELLENRDNQADEIDLLMNGLLTQSRNTRLEKVKFECPKSFLDRLIYTRDKMKIVGERMMYRSSFATPLDIAGLDYEVWSVFENNSISFLSEVMGKSFMDTEKFLIGMKMELPSQVEKMFTVYKVHNEPVGVVFPHIEPNTEQEGRIFWIGIHPYFLGKGLGKNLHLIGLYRLKQEFKAKSYLGITQVDNIQMRNIMLSNGCIQNKNSLISLEYLINE